MLVLKARYWLKLLIAIPMALVIMAIGLHAPGNAGFSKAYMSSQANIESCPTQHDNDADGEGRDHLRKSPCCASLCPVALAIHSLDMFVVEPRIAPALPPVQHSGPPSFDQSGPHRPPR